MGLGDIGSTILSHYKADTRDAEANVKRLRGVEKDRAKELLDGLETQNEKLDRQIDRWGKVAAGVGIAAGAVLALGKGFDAYQRDLQLSTASAGTNIDALQNSFHGLVTETEAMQFAASGLHNDFGTTQEDLKTAAEFTVVLRDRGIELSDAFERVKQAITEANTDALEEFGIVIDAQSATTDAYNQILARMREEVAAAGDAIGLSTDQTSQAMVRAQDAMHDFSVALGHIAVALTPVIEKLAHVAEIAGGGFQYFFGGEEVSQIVAPLSKASRREVLSYFYQIQKQEGDVESLLGEDFFHQPFTAAFSTPSKSDFLSRIGDVTLDNKQDIDVLRKLVAGQQRVDTAIQGAHDRRVAAALKPVTDELGIYAGIITSAVSGTIGFLTDGTTNSPPNTGPSRYAGITNNQATRYVPPPGLAGVAGDITGAGAIENAAGDASSALFQRQVQAVFDARNEAMAGKSTRPSFLESVFGPLEQFVNYGIAFDALAGAATSAYTAWISGQQDISDAVQNSLSQSIAAVGQQMLVESIKNGAFAIAALATGNFGTAATYGAAAAEFAAGAALAGVVAKGLGGGHAGAAPPPSAAPNVLPPSGSSGGGDHRPIIVLVGDDIGEDPRRRKQRIRRAIDRAQRGGGSGTVEFS